ncbi:MAG: TetR/AcrR family transcriptional regulator [Actinomycetota bacterium]|nr:TetR/AcrR family transcriptional regulator [Actinomycetota bacterium]
MPLNKYAPQVATHRRTQAAILEGAKELIATVGLTKMSMIEIADTSQVSRATLYNHFRDKDSVIAALCESECARLITIIDSAANATDALELLSTAICSDRALANMRIHDPAALARGLCAVQSPLWSEFGVGLAVILQSQVLADLAMRWLIGQVLNPLTPEDSRLQAELLISRANL